MVSSPSGLQMEIGRFFFPRRGSHSDPRTRPVPQFLHRASSCLLGATVHGTQGLPALDIKLKGSILVFMGLTD